MDDAWNFSQFPLWRIFLLVWAKLWDSEGCHVDISGVGYNEGDSHVRRPSRLLCYYVQLLTEVIPSSSQLRLLEQNTIDCLKQHEFISHISGSCEVQDQGASRFGSW